MRTERTMCICLAVVSLLTGSVIYIFFRPTSLLMFHWAASIGLMDPIERLRSHPPLATGRLLPWVIYSLPFACWVFSYLLCIEAIWWRTGSQWRDLWFWCIQAAPFASEF